MGRWVRGVEQVGGETESEGGGCFDMGKFFFLCVSPDRFPSIHNALTAKNASRLLPPLLVAGLRRLSVG